MSTEAPVRRVTFSVRTLLVAMLVAAAYCGGWSHARWHYKSELDNAWGQVRQLESTVDAILQEARSTRQR